jgi:uncharacterized coiled-coil protein SlyX
MHNKSLAADGQVAMIVLPRESSPTISAKPDEVGARYDQVNAMLLNEFLKEHQASVEEQHKMEKLEDTVTQQQKKIDALTAGLQKVSAQLEASKPAPQVVTNP